MNIIFKKVDISNFLSIGEATVELNNRGYILINGINKCSTDNAQSNGAGKSSIHDAILWCLTGETSRGAKNVSNIFGDDGALVACEFILDNKLYRITRSRNHSKFKTDLKIEIDGIDKSGKGIRDSEKLLKEYIPDLTVELLGNVVLLGQGMPYKFSSNTPSKRKELLEQLSKSDFMIKDMKERVGIRKDIIEEQIKENDKSLYGIESQISFYDSQILEFEAEINNINSSLNIEDINTTLASLKELTDTENTLKENLALARKVCDVQNNLLIEAINKSKTFDEREDIQNAKNELLKCKTEASSISGNASQIKKQIEQFESVVDICPTCKQKLPGIIKIDTTDLHKQYDALLNEFQKIKDKGIEIKDWLDKEWESFNKACLEEQFSIKEAISKANNAIDLYTTQIEDVGAKIKHINSLLAEYESNQKSGKEKIELFNTKIKSFKEKIEEAIKQREVFEKEADVLERRKSILTTMESLVKRDFRGYLLADVIKYIETKAKEYCNDIFNNNDISFVLDGNDINILYNQKEYELLSGGERQKIDIIIQLAIRDMLKNIMGFSSNIIVFDEIFDFLDQKGTSTLIKTISTRLNDVSTIFIVSHHSDIDIPCDDTITIIKENNGVSHIC